MSRDYWKFIGIVHVEELCSLSQTTPTDIKGNVETEKKC